MKAAVLFLSLFAVVPAALADDAKPRAGSLPARCEVVMSPGMRITATTSVGTIAITAVDELTRSYTWEGATRAIEMQPQAARFFGSLGLFSQCEEWREHHGITTCSTDEGQQHNKTVEEAMKWIKEQERDHQIPFVYRDDGLMVGWAKYSGGLMSVQVWQLLIDGKKPKRLTGSRNDKIVVETVETETVPLVKAVANNDLKAVIDLLAKGADANVKNSVGLPVLLMAIRHGSPSVIEALLKSKADPNVRDIDTDLTPLLEAIIRIGFDRAHIVKMLGILGCPGADQLAMELDVADIVKMLLAAGADVNAASRKEGDLLRGMTPLMFAVEDRCGALVQLLLDKGANVNAKMSNGFTALSWAKLNKSEDGKEANLDVIRKLEAAAVNKK